MPCAGENTGKHHATPSASAVETIAGGWLLKLLDLPRESSIGFVTGATMAIRLPGIGARRGPAAGRLGCRGARPVQRAADYGAIGDDAHATVFSALQFLGLGQDRVVRVKTDDNGRIAVADFAVAAAQVSGPCIVILQAGQINRCVSAPTARTRRPTG